MGIKDIYKNQTVQIRTKDKHLGTQSEHSLFQYTYIKNEVNVSPRQYILIDIDQVSYWCAHRFGTNEHDDNDDDVY